MKTQRKIIAVTVMLLCMVISIAATQKDKPPLFKNLKVLPKNISDEDLDKIMDNTKMNNIQDQFF